MSGTKRFVFDAEAATSFLCAARTEEGKVVFLLVDAKSPGITITPHVGFFISVAEVRFDRVVVSPSHLLGSSGASWATLEAALDKSLPVLSAYQVGATQEVFDMTCEYTRTRVVFGQPIGRFQRVQDHCVDISIHLDQARWATYEAIWRIDSGMDGPRRGSRSQSGGQRWLLSRHQLRAHGLGRPGNRLRPPDDGAQRACPHAVPISWHSRAPQTIDDGCAISKGLKPPPVVCERPWRAGINRGVRLSEAGK